MSDNLGGDWWTKGDIVNQFNLIVAASDESTALETGDGKVTFRMPHAVRITEVRASVVTAPVGSAITVDITKNGVSILSTLLTIDDGEKSSVTATVRAVLNAAVADCADDDEISINIDQVGSSTAGAGLKVAIKGHR
jgi:NMD protein affecting ribosome stability and mRNA decay